MKKTLTFYPSTIGSTQSKMDVDAFDRSVEAFDEGKYLESFHILLDYIDPDLRKKYGNETQTSFDIPHGSIIVNIRIEGDQVNVSAPFMEIPEKGRIPLLRQVAGLNFQDLDLTQINLSEGRLSFYYGCPLSLCNPYKMYYIFQEICRTGDKYDDEFETKFDAKRIYEPEVVPYAPETVDRVYEGIQQSIAECEEALKYFEKERKFGFAWNVIATTFLKISYFAQPQGQLLNELDKAVREHDREDIPLPEVVAQGKKALAKIKETTKEELAEDLYFVETFISPKRRATLKNIQENMEGTFEKASGYLEQGDYMTCCLMIVNNFYRMFFYNNVQDDVNAVVVKALQATSATPWEEAAPILLQAMEDVIEENLQPDEDEEDEDAANVFENIAQLQQQAMQQMQQAMQAGGIDMAEYMKNIQNMMSGMQANTEETDKNE